MRRSGRAAVLRQQLLLGAAILVVALGLLAMHLSLNHTAADPSATRVAVGTAGHLEGLGPTVIDASGTRARLVPPMVGGHPSPDDGACPGCTDHHAMALTCLAALILLAAGWALRRPAAWRGVWLPRRLTEPPQPTLPWRRAPLTLVELSVSRT